MNLVLTVSFQGTPKLILLKLNRFFLALKTGVVVLYTTGHVMARE